MISTLIFMAIGMFIGAKLFPAKLQKYNSVLQQACVFLLIFSMGISLGNGPTFWEDLRTVGWESVVFALTTIAGSILFVWLLTRKLPRPGEAEDAVEEVMEAALAEGAKAASVKEDGGAEPDELTVGGREDA
ncbi:lysine exporter LysO family protein [Zongyangia hominis]|uniref:LysO family transporter n=1 Tax=Zongyangia hominis TaxID=2763677 RepID=A0A926EBR8_9FIRM|nr:lysine exporter LysO family protein [Zongyangia hominis]MBC8570160.1 LysO family transporter [Zongyangia hominis]